VYRLVVVEDEREVHQRLVSLIGKSRCGGFELAAGYENGIDAYDGIMADPPDLVITDIRIPFINGIELSRKLGEALPLIKIAIITGYNEFNYAKEAANLGVIGFISKPVTQEDVDAILCKAEAALDAEFVKAASMTELEAFYENSLPIIREYDLYRLSTMSSVPAAFRRKLLHENIDLGYKYFAMCVLDFDDGVDIERCEMGLSSARGLIDEVLGGLCGIDMFNRSEKLCVIMKSNEGIDISKIESLMESILMRAGRFSGMPLSAGISDVHTAAELPDFAGKSDAYSTESPDSIGTNDMYAAAESPDFAGMYGEALRALEYRSVMGGRKAYVFRNAVPIPAGKSLFGNADVRQLRYLLRYQPADACLEYLSAIRLKLGSEGAENSHYYVVTNILNTLINACDDLEGLYARFNGQMNIYLRLFDSKTADQAFGCLADLAKIVGELNRNVIVDSMKSNFQKILAYMETHYCDSELSLESLASSVNFSVSYICALFKKNGNTTFIKHITAIRMEKAKELLSDPGLKIVDIAESLGYADPYYFSHCFKKYAGVSPKEFRNRE